MANPAGIYLFKVNNENIKTMCEICSKFKIKTLERRRHLLVQSQHWKQQNDVWNLLKSAIKTPERCQWRLSGVFIDNFNFEQISHMVLLFPLLNLNKYMSGGK